MPALWVCPLSRLDETLAASGARTVVTLLRPGSERAPVLPGLRHLRLDLSDISEPLDGHLLPGADHVEALLRFATAWDRASPLLIHCFAGVSRSTAAAYAIACALQPRTDEGKLARELRDASLTATPNRRIVALADEMLGRTGRMVSAIESIGRGADCFEGEPFRLEISCHPVSG